MTLDLMSQFLDSLYASQLLQPQQIEALIRRPEMPQRDVLGITQFLLQQGWLTPFQLQRLQEGRGAELAVTGGYRLTDLIADTTMATLYKATQIAWQKPVLLRIVQPSWLAPRDDAGSYQQRIQPATLLNHPHLINAIDTGMVNGRVYIALEYVEGIDLGSMVRTAGAMPLNRACDFIAQAATALQAGKTRNLVHGDLQPASLLVTPVIYSGGNLIASPTAHVKLADLGLLPLRPTFNEWGDLPTWVREYQAPERLAGGPPSSAADVYGLGQILYFALTNQSPWMTAPLDLLRPDVPAVLVAIQQQMRSAVPEHRPTWDTVIETLRRHVSGQSTAIAAPTAPTMINGVPVASVTLSPGGFDLSSDYVPMATPKVAPLLAALEVDPDSASNLVPEATPVMLVAEVVDDDSDASVPQAMPMTAYTPSAVPATYTPPPYQPAPMPDAFAQVNYQHASDHDEEPDPTPRVKKQVPKSNLMLWLFFGGGLHLTGVALLIAFAFGYFNSSSKPDPDPDTPKQQEVKKKSKYPPPPR